MCVCSSEISVRIKSFNLRDTATWFHVVTWFVTLDGVLDWILDLLTTLSGRAIAQVVSHWLPTAAARVWSCEICGGQSGAGAGLLRVLRFPLSIFIPPISPQLPSSIIWGWYDRPVVAAVPSGLSLTPPRIIVKKNVDHLYTRLGTTSN
jgi:hypothetical protein